MRRVCVVGVGLIGGSLGMALRRRRGAYRVTGLGRRTSQLKTARRRGAVDEGFTDPRKALADADIVVFCTPVQSIVPLARKYLPLFKRGAILTDAGSVKGAILDGMRPLLARRRDLSFVGSHPMAGSQRTGVENASAGLFKGAVCAVTTPAPAGAAAVVRRLWTDAGSRCIVIDARRHDALLALTSHLPHLLAFTLFSQVSSAARRDRRVRALVAGSFNDMTRVAASDAELWSGILQLNRPAVMRALSDFGDTIRRLNGKKGAGLQREITRISREKKAWSA
jgi:prephenate dehydrogenase